MKHTVLFTGGLDSTYRLCQLARDKEAVVQPVYILFPDDGKSPHIRPELQREIEAQDKVLEFITTHPETKAMILPIRRIHRDAIPQDIRVMELESYLAEYQLGWQYLYFAILAKYYPKLELCQEGYPDVTLTDKLEFQMEGQYRVLSPNVCDERLATLFKGLSWPIFGTTRKQMVQDIKAWGYSGIFDRIWWCYHNINGKPCGICDNCRAKIVAGLKELFTKEAIHRYLVYMFVRAHYNFYYWQAAFWDYFFRDKFLAEEKYNKRTTEFYKSLDSVLKLDDRRLKKIIIKGSLEYGYTPSRKQRILAYKKDLTREHLLDYLK